MRPSLLVRGAPKPVPSWRSVNAPCDAGQKAANQTLCRINMSVYRSERDKPLGKILTKLARRMKIRRDFNEGDVLRLLNKSPELIVDVGVRSGTPWLYDLYPDAKFLLIDPMRGGVEMIRSFPKNYRFINQGLGAQPGSLMLNEMGAQSGFLERTALTAGPVEATYEIEINTLDNVLDMEPSGSVGLKIDTEGYEMEVMRGLQRHLQRVEFVVSEVSVKNRFIGSYSFHEYVAFMEKKGLRFYRIANSANVNPQNYYDCIFLKESDPLFG